MVLPPQESAALCATASTPYAIPDTIVYPYPTRSRASLSVTSAPYDVTLRVPTIAIVLERSQASPVFLPFI